MDTIGWMLLKHRTYNDAWGDPAKMDPMVVWLIDEIEDSLPKGCSVKIHCGYKEGGHTPNSYHYKGEAIDWHIVGMSPAAAEEHVIKFLHKPKAVNGKEIKLIEIVGFGCYPEWLNPGFHIDRRGVRASWSMVGGKYVAYEIGAKLMKANMS